MRSNRQNRQRAASPPRSVLLLVLGLLLSLASPLAAPPFSGTIFIDPDIVTADDPSAYQSLEYAGTGNRRMFDRRVNDWVNRNAFLFDARFADGLAIEVQVNPEFLTRDAAETEALRFLHAIGQLPTALRKDVRTVWLHKGLQPFGGGNNNLLIHSGQADAYIRDGILEETLMHEASHTSLDACYAAAPGWLAAQQADPEFISTYARDHPLREDIAESFVPYFAVQFRRSRISDSLADTISRTIPHRIAYFNTLGLDMYPAGAPEPLVILRWRLDLERKKLGLIWSSRDGVAYALETSPDLLAWDSIGAAIVADSIETTHEIDLQSLEGLIFGRVRQKP